VVTYTSVPPGEYQPKILLANSVMGYAIFDRSGIVSVGSVDQDVLTSPDTSKTNDLKTQSFLLSNLVLYLIRTNKGRMDFFDKNVLKIIPDITAIPDTPLTITDSYLEKLLAMTADERECIERYADSGEGRLSIEQRQVLLDFDIANYMTPKQIDYTQNLIRKEQAELQQKRKDRESKKANKTRKASKFPKTAEAAPAPDSKREGKGPSTRNTRKPKVLRTRRKRKHQRSKPSTSTRRN
jgi:hypothetical protein